jgi:hypothetical protein
MYEEKALLATEVLLQGALSFLTLSFSSGNITSYVPLYGFIMDEMSIFSCLV